MYEREAGTMMERAKVGRSAERARQNMVVGGQEKGRVALELFGTGLMRDFASCRVKRVTKGQPTFEKGPPLYVHA